MHLPCWSVGLTVAERGVRTLERTLASLHAAGFPRPRLFCDGEVELPEGYEVTRHIPPIGGWPNFWLALTELVARQPEADFFFIVQDDVVFCQGVAEYTANSEFPRDCGFISLFTPACNSVMGDTEVGRWHSFPIGYGMTGAPALAFPRERAFEFLAHPWTVNHRRAAPKSRHFRGDGLHHVDGVVGEWCHLMGLKGYCHTPSLSQHIGESSAMYPGFTGKQDRRFADTFAGEEADVRR